MKDNNEVKQEEPKTKKTKTIDRNTSESGFQLYGVQHGLVSSQ